MSSSSSGTSRSGNALGQALGNGRLAHTGLTNQNGVVLGAAGKDLDDPLDLLFTADDGVQLAPGGSLRQIPVNSAKVLAFLLSSRWDTGILPFAAARSPH